MKRFIKGIATVLLCIGVLSAFAGCGAFEGNLDSLFGFLNAAKCEHAFADEGIITQDGEGYVLVRHCTKCDKDISELANVISVNEKFLYNESKHWNNVSCETNMPESRAANGHNKPNHQTFKGNYADHDYDENGVCKTCQYNDRESQGLEFADNDNGDGYILVGVGECTDKHINVPKEHNNKPVVGIGDNAFDNRKNDDGTEEKSNIVGITIPDTVISISCTAFSDCVQLNNFLVDAANEVFEAANNCLINTNLQSLVRGCEFSIIPDDGSVVAIGSYAFAGCEGLVSVTIPDSIEDIGDKAFFECTALIEVTMPENINIGIDVFRGSIHVEIKIEHTLTFVPAVEATCETAGNIAHYKCSDCDYLFEDEEGTVRLYNAEIPAAHEFANGVCGKCGQMLDSVRIVAIDEIPFLGKFALGTMEDAIGLPGTIYVTTADGVRHEVKVNWELSDYKKDQVGTYTIRGHIVPGVLHFDGNLNGEVSASIEVVEYMKGTADIVFVLDITGSMSDEIDNVKNNIASFAIALEERGVSARWAVVTYADFESYHNGRYEESEIIMNGASEWFISASEYATAIGGIQIGYGGDGPEMAIDGMMLATTLTSRKNARTIFILVTDADNKVTNNYGVESMEQMAGILADKDITTSVIAPTNYYYEYQVLVDQTGGLTANIYGNFGADLLDGLVPIIENEVLE